MPLYFLNIRKSTTWWSNLCSRTRALVVNVISIFNSNVVVPQHPSNFPFQIGDSTE